jgi:hypothetical protein
LEILWIFTILPLVYEYFYRLRHKEIADILNLTESHIRYASGVLDSTILGGISTCGTPLVSLGGGLLAYA